MFSSLLIAPSSEAQEGRPDPWTGVEEMIVVGGAGLNTLIEAPSSVIAFDSAEILAKGISDVGDLAEFTPNLEINSAFNASSPELFIRGVGLRDSNANAASAVAVITDGVYYNSPTGQLAQLFDLKNVSVLRGPQGSQYGRNASAGAILIESARPSGEFGGRVNFTYGRFNLVDTEGYVEAPVVQDLIAVRLAGKIVRRDPLGRNRCGSGAPFEPGLDVGLLRSGYTVACATSENTLALLRNTFPDTSARVNDQDNWAARAQVLITPLPEMRILLNVHGGQNRSLAPSFQQVGLREPANNFPLWRNRLDYFDADRCYSFDSSGFRCLANHRGEDRGDPWSGEYSATPPENLDLFGTFLRVEWDLGAWSLTSVTSYESNDRVAGLDVDASPFITSERLVEDDAWQIMEDLRLTTTDPGLLDLTLGAFFLYEELNAESFFRGLNSGGGLGQLGQTFEQTTTYLGLFGVGKLNLDEQFAIEVGLRMNVEKKAFDITARNVLIQNDMEIPVSIPGLNILQGSEESLDIVPSGDVILTYEPTADAKIYAKYVRGYKGRHFNAGGTDPRTVIEPADPEFVNSFEVGFSSKWLDGLLSWNGATFLYLYENQQIFQLQTASGGSFPINQLINAEDSRIYGIETDFRINWEGLNVFVSFGWLYSEYTDFRNEFTVTRPGPTGELIRLVTVNGFSGNRLVNSPEISINGTLSYEWNLGRLGTLTPRFDYRFKDEIFYTPRNNPNLGDNERWIFDARIDYQVPDGRASLGFWVRNLTDELYRSTVVGGINDNAVVVGVADPRTYGVTAMVSF